MKITEEDHKKVGNVVVDLNKSYLSLKDYIPIMNFENDEDEQKVLKAMQVIESKLSNIREAKGYKELKNTIKIKKIIGE